MKGLKIMTKTVNEIVSEKICEKIKMAIKNKEPLPWQKPWVWANAPRNYLGSEYKGINTLLLDEGEYLTWTQICDLKKHNPDVKLKKGCKKDIVVYFNFKEFDKETISDNGEKVITKQSVPFLRYYNVYNIKYVEGIQSKVKETTYNHKPIERAEQILKGYTKAENIKVKHIKGNKACYSLSSDSITLPLISQFEKLEEYYSTAFHEISHSTMTRLGRSTSGYFGDAEYSKEELIAEMSASMLLAHCGINTPASEKNNIAYMRNWLKVLQDNTTWLASACSKAQKATEYILEKSKNNISKGDTENDKSK